MSDTIVVAFSNQKGGVGKSTLTVLLASYLYYEKGIKVAIMDCDSPQHSLVGERNRELKTVSETEHLAQMAHELLTKTGLQPYAIMKIPLKKPCSASVSISAETMTRKSCSSTSRVR